MEFYRTILNLEVTEKPIDNPTVSRTHQVKIRSQYTRGLDCVDNYTHVETLVSIKNRSSGQGNGTFRGKGIHHCNKLEKISENMHWIQDPTGTVFILGEMANEE